MNISDTISKALKEKNPSLFLLILVNMVPIFGVIFLYWSPMYIIYLYWTETFIIGFFNILKILFSGKEYSFVQIIGKLSTIVFFTVHFGIFILVQGIFILSLDPFFQKQNSDYNFNLENIDVLMISLGENLWWPALLLFGSHLFSFIYNYIVQKEYLNQDSFSLMTKPYSRVFVQQFIAIFGSIIIMSFKNGIVWVLVLLVIFKTIADAISHVSEHKKQPIILNTTSD